MDEAFKRWYVCIPTNIYYFNLVWLIYPKWKVKKDKSESVIGLDHDGHAEGDHIDVDRFVLDGVHFEEVVGLGLPELAFVYMIQLL